MGLTAAGDVRADALAAYGFAVFVADNGPKLADRADRICGPAARRKPNYVAVDFYQKPETGAASQAPPTRPPVARSGTWS